MAGYHVIHRATTKAKYRAIESKLTLPAVLCDCRSDIKAGEDGVFPEFFFGFYGWPYGVDIGVIYYGLGSEAKTFRLFSHGFDNTQADHPKHVIISAKKGDEIHLKSWIEGTNLWLEARKGSGTGIVLGSILQKLTDGAATALYNKSIINRELTMASNKTDHIPSPAVFSDTCWSEGILYYYDIVDKTEKTEPFSTGNTKFTQYADDEEKMNDKRFGWIPGVDDANGCVREYASCDFRSENPYDLNNDDVVDQQDLDIAKGYYRAEAGDPDWETTRVADVDNSDVVDIFDFMEIYANFTKQGEE